MSNQSEATAQLGALPFGNIIGGPLVAAVEAQATAAKSTVDFIRSVAFKNDGETLNDVKFSFKSKQALPLPALPSGVTPQDVSKYAAASPTLSPSPLPVIEGVPPQVATAIAAIAAAIAAAGAAVPAAAAAAAAKPYAAALAAYNSGVSTEPELLSILNTSSLALADLAVNKAAAQYAIAFGGSGFVYVESSLSVPLLVIVPIPYIRIEEMTIDFKANISASTTTNDKTDETTNLDAKADASISGGWGAIKANANFSASYSSKKDSTATKDSKYSVEYTMDIHVLAKSEAMPAGMSKVLNMLNDSIHSEAKPAKTT